MNNNSLSKNDILKYKKLLNKKYRYLNQEFLIEGKNLIEEASKHSNLLKLIITSDQNFKIKNFKVIYTTYENICKLSTTKTPQEYIGVCNFIKNKEINNANVVLALDNINDPGNLGTIIRTAHSFGLENIIVSGVDIYNPKVLRSTQGSLFNINIINTKNIKDSILDLKNRGYKIVGSLLKGAKNYHEVNLDNLKFVLILGNESHGISDEIIEILDYKVYIPIKFESLNVAIAGAILLSKYLK